MINLNVTCINVKFAHEFFDEDEPTPEDRLSLPKFTLIYLLLLDIKVFTIFIKSCYICSYFKFIYSISEKQYSVKTQ